MAALIIVGTAYIANTGVCNLESIQPRSREKGTQNVRVIEVPPRSSTNVVAPG